MKKSVILIMMMVISLLVTGCHSKRRDVAEWSILVYMAGDNNLEEFGIEDLNEMEMVGSTRNLHVLVLFDRSPYYDTTNGNWSGARLFRVQAGSDPNTIESPVLKDYGELDMSDPNTLRDFIVYCQKSYPAKKHALILWNHGAGVYPRTIRSPDSGLRIDYPITKGICQDNGSGNAPWNCLTTDEVRQALTMARMQTGKKVDLICMDACLMQMVEVAYEWRNDTDYLVGSEEEVGLNGNNYYTLLKGLVNYPGMNPETLAVHLVEDYSANYEGMSSTYSAVRLGKDLENMVNGEFNDFASALILQLDQSHTRDALTAIREKTTAFSSFSNDYNECHDLYDFAEEIKSCTDLNMQIISSKLMTAIKRVVIAHRETGKFSADTPAYGLSILFPNKEEWTVKYQGEDGYRALEFSKDTMWDEFITKYVGAENLP